MEVVDVVELVESGVVPRAVEEAVVTLTEDRGDRAGPPSAPVTTTTVTMTTAASRSTAKRRRRWMLGGEGRRVASLELVVREPRLTLA
ncbi:MAG: hypothetical protein ACRDNK_21005 [Solirubrobacteraceae bacterium]